MDTKLLEQFILDIEKNKKTLEKKFIHLQETEFIAVSGNGLCEIVMNGKFEVVRCKLDDKILGDKETIQDLVATAVTEVIARINTEIKKLEQELLPKGIF